MFSFIKYPSAANGWFPVDTFLCNSKNTEWFLNPSYPAEGASEDGIALTELVPDFSTSIFQKDVMVYFGFAPLETTWSQKDQDTHTHTHLKKKVHTSSGSSSAASGLDWAQVRLPPTSYAVQFDAVVIHLLYAQILMQSFSFSFRT